MIRLKNSGTKFEHPSFLKLFNRIFVVVFLLFAAVQYNDPDPYLWMPLYGYGAMVCYLAQKNKYILPWAFGGVAIYMSYAIFLLVADQGVIYWLQQKQHESIMQTMQAEKAWIENTREFFGLLILSAVLGFNIYRQSSRARLTAPQQPDSQRVKN